MMRSLRRAVVIGVWILVVEVLRRLGVSKAGKRLQPGRPGRPRSRSLRAALILLGYTGRKGPFGGVSDDLSARALALEDAQGRRAVVVSADLVGFQAAVVTDAVTTPPDRRADGPGPRTVDLQRLAHPHGAGRQPGSEPEAQRRPPGYDAGAGRGDDRLHPPAAGSTRRSGWSGPRRLEAGRGSLVDRPHERPHQPSASEVGRGRHGTQPGCSGG